MLNLWLAPGAVQAAGATFTTTTTIARHIHLAMFRQCRAILELFSGVTPCLPR